MFYVLDEVYNGQIWSPEVHVFVSRFFPSYRPGGKNDGKQSVDYLHEREWRVPKDLTFRYNQVEFVIVNKYENIDEIPSDIRATIGLNKFLVMEAYAQIETLWPVHRMPEMKKSLKPKT